MKRAFRGTASLLRESLPQKAQKSKNYLQSSRLLSSKATVNIPAGVISLNAISGFFSGYIKPSFLASYSLSLLLSSRYFTLYCNSSSKTA